MGEADDLLDIRSVADTGPRGRTATLGEAAVLDLRPEACSDGMSEREYRYHADFDIAGQQLHGCADSVEVLDRPAP